MTRHQLGLAATALVFATGCIDTRDLLFGGADTPSRSYASVVLSDSPVAYWPLDELVNGVFSEDASGNELDAFASTDGGMKAGVPGALGTAIRLTEGDKLSVATPHPLSFAETSYTLEAWVRLDGSPQANLWTCNLDDGYLTFVSDDKMYHKRYDSGDLTDVVHFDSVSLVEFRHLVLVHDSEADSGNTQWFLDGDPGSIPQDTNVSWMPQDTEFRLAFGGQSLDGEVTVDEVAVYDVALSAERIKAHYLCGASQDCD